LARARPSSGSDVAPLTAARDPLGHEAASTRPALVLLVTLRAIDGNDLELSRNDRDPYGASFPDLTREVAHLASRLACDGAKLRPPDHETTDLAHVRDPIGA
jgi:hypothetical protein